MSPNRMRLGIAGLLAGGALTGGLLFGGALVSAQTGRQSRGGSDGDSGRLDDAIGHAPRQRNAFGQHRGSALRQREERP